MIPHSCCAHATDALKARAKPMVSEARVRDLMVSLLLFGVCRRRLAAVARLAGLHVLVELAGEMKAFEHELYRRGDGGGIFRPELLARSVERARLTDLTHIGVRRHHVR